MTSSNTLSIRNNQAVDLKEIPQVSYTLFMGTNLDLLRTQSQCHCVMLFGYKSREKTIILIMLWISENPKVEYV